MKRCEQIKEQIPEFLYGELDSSEKNKLEKHFKSCDACRDELRKMENLFEVLDQHRNDDPGVRFWDETWKRFEDKAVLSDVNQKTVYSRLSKNRWFLRIAAGLILVMLGFVLGRSHFWGPNRPMVVATSQNIVNQENSPVLVDYLQRSKVILLGVIKLDPNDENLKEFDFKREKEVSNRLLNDAEILKKNLKESGNKKAAALVEELELILLQVSHSDSENPFWIDLIKDAEKKKSILFRINMEEMRSSTPTESSPIVKPDSQI
jgi:hypothetical protein